MINTKEMIKDTLNENGVKDTDALSELLLKEIYYECEEYVSNFKDEFLRILKTDDNGDFHEDVDMVSIGEVKEALELAGVEVSRANKLFKD